MAGRLQVARRPEFMGIRGVWSAAASWVSPGSDSIFPPQRKPWSVLISIGRRAVGLARDGAASRCPLRRGRSSCALRRRVPSSTSSRNTDATRLDNRYRRRPLCDGSIPVRHGGPTAEERDALRRRRLTADEPHLATWGLTWRTESVAVGAVESALLLTFIGSRVHRGKREVSRCTFAHDNRMAGQGRCGPM